MADSAAINLGITTTLSVDVDGDSRPQGPAPDFGADESSAGAGGATYLPLILKQTD
jgi:hypothetical protein